MALRDVRANPPEMLRFCCQLIKSVATKKKKKILNTERGRGTVIPNMGVHFSIYVL